MYRSDGGSGRLGGPDPCPLPGVTDALRRYWQMQELFARRPHGQRRTVATRPAVTGPSKGTTDTRNGWPYRAKRTGLVADSSGLVRRSIRRRLPSRAGQPRSSSAGLLEIGSSDNGALVVHAPDPPHVAHEILLTARVPPGAEASPAPRGRRRSGWSRRGTGHQPSPRGGGSKSPNPLTLSNQLTTLGLSARAGFHRLSAPDVDGRVNITGPVRGVRAPDGRRETP